MLFFRSFLPRMIFAVSLLQARAVYVRVDLSRGDVGVAQHGLDGTEIGAPFQEMRGERMAQGMRRHPLLDSCR